MGDLSIIPHLFINSSIYLYQHKFSDSDFTCWVINYYYFISFLSLKLFQLWTLGTISVVSCVPLRYLHCFVFWAFTFFWHYMMLQTHLIYISCHSPRLRHLSRELWFLSLENDIRNQDLDAECSHWCWAVVVFYV